ncbi:DUF1471 domain-containing protein [Shimwellia blattae]|uniref:Putative UPF0379 protein yjfY n=1 Tax=Shimwellia blattae (strain ATCC 29907 / DSM 4481 / JCM 1650 / NBRC 105725 / CDC 9005-74) TaxID=630626 RepID=I2BDL3_SHIBC|nr:DUF1471 domain-containing protein [Shimwellia blattae]AFJ48617.1 putative UPF0379 protein yjfY precursor [Shimwellia blattae DSM 4481 = NBRC 105725]GAB81347.1 hypothetical protein YjfY [Shimwellia blattae DSM 4481 = NBRC 105725]VDY66107.1 Protein of uncharacterised function (DUF1471) [Shimwellia blattae]VEC26992.1 Protein of uncharacterised function (DUF1471) [Shimwellia blattae]
MRAIAIAMMTTLFFVATSASAAIKVSASQARNMDDVQSLGVIYINHNFATEEEATRALDDRADTKGARFYSPILMHEPGSNGNLHASAELYR